MMDELLVRIWLRMARTGMVHGTTRTLPTRDFSTVPVLQLIIEINRLAPQKVGREKRTGGGISKLSQ